MYRVEVVVGEGEINHYRSWQSLRCVVLVLDLSSSAVDSVSNYYRGYRETSGYFLHVLN